MLLAVVTGLEGLMNVVVGDILPSMVFGTIGVNAIVLGDNLEGDVGDIGTSSDELFANDGIVGLVLIVARLGLRIGLLSETLSVLIPDADFGAAGNDIFILEIKI